MQNSLEQLKNSLKEMFQFQNNDLNFGIYKIYKLKQKEIEKFIDDNLENTVKKELQNVSNLEEKSNLLELELFLKWFNQEKLLEDINSNYEKIDWTINVFWNWESEKLKEILKSKRAWSIEVDLENKIYNYILNFFELYYNEGDFGYNTRSLNSYKVEYDEDYNGNDIMFHWKHKGSYYIKTGNGFNSVKFELENKNIEFLLETNDESEAEEISQNNNRETEFKHYKYNRIENTWNNDFKVIFNLAKISTPKEEIFKNIFKEIFGKDLENEFLYNKDWKNIFNSLDENFGEVENWNIKWFTQLKIKKDDLVKKYDTNFWKTEKINKSFDELDENIENEKILKILWSLDSKLNSFYIWNDSDFFIHKNLNLFLTHEKEKFIKNNILWDLNTILNSKIDNTSLVIAKTFNEITSKIIEFLSTIEEFQKWIFEIKKKVLVSEYCITLDKIDEKFYEEILKNKNQIIEWKNLGFIDDEKILDLEYLRNNKTLNIDTKFFDKKVKDEILGSFENLDEETNGILINSENFQALNLLKNKYRWKVKCIYIDPPYNTGSDWFVYKDSFKHSSWLSMMENRLELAREFLSDDWVIFVSIDDNEQDNLKKLMDEVFGNENFVANFIWTRKKKWSFLSKKVRKMTEFVICFEKKENDNKFFWENAYNNKYQPIVKRTNKEKNLFFKKWTVKTTLNDWFYQKWFYGNSETWINFLEDFEVKNNFIINNFQCSWKFVWTQEFLENEIKNWTKVELSSKFWFNVLRFNQDEKTKTPSTIINSENNVWTNEDATIEIQNLFWWEIWAVFSYNKPNSLIKYLINFNTNPNDIIFDFFSWSWTTQHAVIELNKEDNWKRKYIWVEMWEYFDTVTKPRIQKVIYSSNWKNWKPLDNSGSSQILKYQVLEQYEDILDKLETDNEYLPEWLDLKYLYKKEEIQLNSNLNLRKPFENNCFYGKSQKQTQIDLIETYNYIKGNNIENIKTFEIAWKYYKCVKIWNILQIWRDIEVAENDLENISEILKNYENIEILEVNVEIYSLERDKFGSLELNWKNFDIEIIDESLFNE